MLSWRNRRAHRWSSAFQAVRSTANGIYRRRLATAEECHSVAKPPHFVVSWRIGNPPYDGSRVRDRNYLYNCIQVRPGPDE